MVKSYRFEELELLVQAIGVAYVELFQFRLLL